MTTSPVLAQWASRSPVGSLRDSRGAFIANHELELALSATETALLGPSQITVETLQRMIGEGDGPTLLDVRSPAEFSAIRIPGSVNVPLDILHDHRGVIGSHLADDVVLVCRSGQRADQAQRILGETDAAETQVLDGGIQAWRRAGAPVIQGRAPWGLERQVRLLAGSVVFFGVAASHVAPRLKWISGLVGASLTVAAITDTCIAGHLLAKLPYNRATRANVDTVVSALSSAS
jgi:rhodanese-related sulfurtransferase